MISKRRTQARYPSGEGKGTSALTHMFMTEKALENYPILEPYFSYYRQKMIDGSREEDTIYFPNDHFYNPTTGKGLDFLGQHDSALDTAKYLWETWVIDKYKEGEKYHVYHALGRIAHLLEDMTSPAHTHLIPHWDIILGWPCPDDLYEEYCKATASGNTYTTSGRVDYNSLDDFFYNTALLSWGSASVTINSVSPDTVNDIVNNTYGRPETGKNYAEYINKQAYLTDARKDTLAKYLVAGVIQRVAGLFYYFWQNRPTIDPNYIDLFSLYWEDQNRSTTINVRDEVTHAVRLRNLGDPTNVRVIIDIDYYDGESWHDLSYYDDTFYLIPNEEKDITVGPSKEIPLQARKLEAKYKLLYAGVTREPIASGVWVEGAELDIRVSPEEIHITQVPPQPVSIIFTVKNKAMGNPIQGATVYVYSNEYGIPAGEKTTDASGQVTFSGSLNNEKNGQINYHVDGPARDNYKRLGGEIRVLDKHPPIITYGPIGTNTTWSWIDIKWTTHEPATSIVEYGTSTNYGKIVQNLLRTKDHLIYLGGLQAATVYHYRVKSIDGADNTTQTSDLTFLTDTNGIPPKIEILSPQAGDVWSGERNIKWWIFTYHPGTMAIQVSKDGGGSWEKKEYLVSFAKGTYTQEYAFNTWEWPDGDNYKIQLQARNIAGGSTDWVVSGRFTINNYPSESAALSVYPNPYNRHIGAWFPFELNEQATVEVRITIDGVRIKVLSVTRNPGWYKSRDKAIFWNGLNEAGDKIAYGNILEYRVYINGSLKKVGQLAALADNIRDINVTSPAAGSVNKGIVNINWNTVNSGNISLDYSKDGGYNWTSIAPNIANTGSYPWDTTNLEDSSNYRIKTTIQDGNKWSNDYSGVFALDNVPAPVPPVVKILSPKEGDVLTGVVNISWEATDPASKSLSINIHYRPDKGDTWYPIALKEVNDGSYSWDTNLVSDGIYDIRVVADNGELIAGTTLSVIEILNTSIDGRGWGNKINICALTGKEWDDDETIESYNNIAVRENLVCVVYELDGYLCFRQSTDGGDTWTSNERIYKGNVYKPALTIDKNKNIHIVWGNDEGIYYINNTSEVWSVPQKISNVPARYSYPAIVTEGNDIHIVWLKQLDIFYRKSPDLGNTWGEEKCLVQHSVTHTTDKGSSRGWKQFKIEVKGNNVYLAWTKFVTLKVEELWFKRSIDRGENWEEGMYVTTMCLGPFAMKVDKVDNDKIYVVYSRDKEKDGTVEIYYQQSDNRGLNWGSGTVVAYNVNLGEWRWIMIDIDKLGDYLYLIWGVSQGIGVARIGGKMGDIYYMRSKDGIKWESKIGFAYNDDKKSVLPSIVSDRDRLHVTWYEETMGLDKDINIYYRYKLLDITPPTKPVVIDAGRYTGTNTQLHASWYSKDDESGIREYQYAIGSAQGLRDILDWTSAGTSTSGTITGLNLQNGKTYYLSVKARNGGGLYSDIGYSDGITVDITPSSVPVVIDEGTYTTINKLSGNWQAEDSESGVNYYYAIGTTQGGTDTVDWKSAGASTGVAHADINLTAGKTYYFSVKARNSAGLWSENPGYSNGITFLQPKLTSTIPTSGTIGTIVIIKGEGYLATEQIRIDFGTTLTICLTTADTQGSFTATFKVDSQGYGTKTITATGLLSNAICYAKFNIKPTSVSIRGSVGDSISNRVIAGAVIELIQDNQVKLSTTTDNNGEYRIDELTPGIYQINVKKERIHYQWIRVRRGFSWVWRLITWRVLEYIPHTRFGVLVDGNNNVDFYLSEASWVENAHIYEGNETNTDERKNMDVSIKVNYDPHYWFYLYPNDSSFKIESFSRQPIGENGCVKRSSWWWGEYRWYDIDWDNGSYIDRNNNRLHIKVWIGGYWWRKAYFNYRYTIDAKKEKGLSSFSPVLRLEPPKRRVISPGKISLQVMPKEERKRLNVTGEEGEVVSIIAKEVEDSLTTVNIKLQFDQNKVKIVDISAPVLPDPGLVVFSGADINNEEGKVSIDTLIVDKEMLVGTDTNELIGTDSSVSCGTVTLIEEGTKTASEENIAPIAHVIIKPNKTKGAKTLSLDDILSCIKILDVELKNAQGEEIQVNVDDKPPQPTYESNLDNAYCYPNPTRMGEITFAKLTKQVKVRIFNIAGELVYKDEWITNGEWSWRCINNDGEKVASGIYIYILQDSVSGSMKRGKLGVIR